MATSEHTETKAASIFQRAFDMARGAATEMDLPVESYHDTQWTMVFKLYDEACERVREKEAARGNPISEGDVMGEEYLARVEEQLRGDARLALGDWRLDPTGVSYSKNFRSNGELKRAMDVITYLELGHNVEAGLTHEEKFPCEVQAGWYHGDDEIQRRKSATATKLVLPRERMERVFSRENPELALNL